MYQVSILCNKCLNEDFRSREGLMGPLSRVVNLKILYQFGDEDLVIWTATSASMNRSTASEILEWMINPLCATAFIDILFENIKIHYEKKQMFKQLLWNTVIYLVSAVIHIHSIKLDNANIIWRSKLVICYVDNFVSLPSKLNIAHKR